MTEKFTLTHGDYSITVGKSSFVPDVDKNPIILYLITNEVTGVVEFESHTITKALEACKHLSSAWEDRNSTLSSLQQVKVHH